MDIDVAVFQCPSCKRGIVNRRAQICVLCGAAIPDSLRFSPDEIAALDRAGLRSPEQGRQVRAEPGSTPLPQSSSENLSTFEKLGMLIDVIDILTDV
jgi:hypothetical protein